MISQTYERLRIWRQAMVLARQVYRAGARFPAEEKAGLVATMRRGAAAVAGKIADASGQDDPGAAARGFESAAAALRELETHLLLSRRLRMIRPWALRPLRRRCRMVEALLTEEMDACAQEIEAGRTESEAPDAVRLAA